MTRFNWRPESQEGRYLPVSGGWHSSNGQPWGRQTKEVRNVVQNEFWTGWDVGAALPEGQVSMDEMNVVLISGRLLSIMVVFLTEMFADWTNTCVGRTRTWVNSDLPPARSPPFPLWYGLFPPITPMPLRYLHGYHSGLAYSALSLHVVRCRATRYFCGQHLLDLDLTHRIWVNYQSDFWNYFSDEGFLKIKATLAPHFRFSQVEEFLA